MIIKTFFFTSIIAFMVICAAVASEQVVTSSTSVTSNPKRGGALAPTNFISDQKLNESLPAQSFKDGNWGEIILGYQVSLRFEKNSYKTNEPLVAIVLIRNLNDSGLTNQLMGYMRFVSVYDLYPMAFSICDSAGQSVLLNDVNNAFQNVNELRFRHLGPGTQDKFVEQLNHLFPSNPGKYYVSASFRIPGWKISQFSDKGAPVFEAIQKNPIPRKKANDGGKPSLVEIKSGLVPIEIK